MKQDNYDIFVVGGGINGCGIARDASGRGYRVALAEMYDLGALTSSASSKLIHGGLRYLEHYAFWLVRSALKERDVLLQIAPHLVKPMRFILPYDKQQRPFWLLRLGLFLYDHLAKRKEFASTSVIDFRRSYKNILKDSYAYGFEYSDARVDDSRLVVANARHASKLGANILVGWRVVKAIREDGNWRIFLENRTGEKKEVTASYVINAAGPYVDEALGILQTEKQANIRLVKGSHIVVPAIYHHDRAYILQNKDGRIVFTIPYQKDFTLIGTTDIDFEGDPVKASIDDEERNYLCDVVNIYFDKTISKEMIVWEYSGVRPLYDNGSSKAQETSRDYVLKENIIDNNARSLTVYGGKITTYRKLSEDVMKRVDKTFRNHTKNWTAKVPLPGGDITYSNLEGLRRRFKLMRSEFSNDAVRRITEAYGSECLEIFSLDKDLGKNFGHEFYECELLWMLKEEWAHTLEDVLWRRSKLGLYLNSEEQQTLQSFLDNFHKIKK